MAKRAISGPAERLGRGHPSRYPRKHPTPRHGYFFCKKRRAISGPAAAVIFLAIGAAILLSTSYISDLFGSATFQKRIALKLMISRPYQIGQKVMSLIDSAYQEAALESTIDVGKTGSGRAVWYCNAPQPPSISQVRAALCKRTHTLAGNIISSRISQYNYSVQLPTCIFLNITGPESFALYARGQQVVGPGVSSVGSTSINVTSRFWVLYNSLTDWVEDDMGGLFNNLCEKANKPCQVRLCSCDSNVVNDGLDEIFSEVGLSEAEIQQAVDKSLAELTKSLDSDVECSSKLNVVLDNDPVYSTKSTLGCSCNINLPSGCSNVPTYIEDSTDTSQMNECDDDTECVRCFDDNCTSILPAYGCSAPFRMEVSTLGSVNLTTLAKQVGFHHEHASKLDSTVFKSKMLISDLVLKDFEIPTLFNFVNGRVAVVDQETYDKVRSTYTEQIFKSKGFSTKYFEVASGAVAQLYPFWNNLTQVDSRLLAAHYYDFGAKILAPDVEFNCTGLLPQALATEIVEYPQNGTELLLGMNRKAYVYGTIECEDSKYLIEDRNLVLDLDFWVSLERDCSQPSQCNGTSTNCQGALTLPLPNSPGPCPKCFKHKDVQGVTIRRAEDSSIKCKHFSGSNTICEFQYDSQSVLKQLPADDRIFSVPCTCYLNDEEADCESVVYLNYTENVRPEVRCPVAAPSGTFYSDYLGVRNCASIEERFGYNIVGQVCDIKCYETDGVIKCGDCQPDFDYQCGCSSCAFEINPSEYSYNGGQDLYWIGENNIHYSNGTLAYTQDPSVDANILSSTCTSLEPSFSCSGDLYLDNTTLSMFGGLFGKSRDIEYSACLVPVTLNSGGAFVDICDCAEQATDPQLRTDIARFSSDYFEKLSQDSGFVECCEVCSLARVCAIEENPKCQYQGDSCKDILVNIGANKNDPDWPRFLSCCTDNCVSSCTKCSCMDENEPFCDNPVCGLVWENTCYPSVLNPSHSTCSSFSCRDYSDTTSFVSTNFDPQGEYSAMTCTPYSSGLGCGSEGLCGICSSSLLIAVTGRTSPYSEITGFCETSSAPSLFDICYTELKDEDKHSACVGVSCKYSTGGFECADKSAGSPCVTGLSGNICGQCTGSGMCGSNSTSEGRYCLPVVQDTSIGLISHWDYDSHNLGCCCKDELCTQKQECSVSNGLCDLDCQGFDPDCSVVADVARGCSNCNYCVSGVCIPNSGQSCGANCTIEIQTVSGVEIGTCVC